MTAQTVESFWAKIDRSDTGCWPWLGRPTKLGYGRCPAPGRPKRLVMAHRIAWELTNGPIPPGVFALHRCDNPPCCNPDHLYIGTLKDNARDAVRAGHMGKGNRKRTHCKLGHPFDYVSPDGRRGCRTCRSRQARESEQRNGRWHPPSHYTHVETAQMRDASNALDGLLEGVG